MQLVTIEVLKICDENHKVYSSPILYLSKCQGLRNLTKPLQGNTVTDNPVIWFEKHELHVCQQVTINYVSSSALVLAPVPAPVPGCESPILYSGVTTKQVYTGVHTCGYTWLQGILMSYLPINLFVTLVTAFHLLNTILINSLKSRAFTPSNWINQRKIQLRETELKLRYWTHNLSFSPRIQM